MKKFKKVIAVTLVAAMMMSLSGCEINLDRFLGRDDGVSTEDVIIGEEDTPQNPSSGSSNGSSNGGKPGLGLGALFGKEDPAADGNVGGTGKYAYAEATDPQATDEFHKWLEDYFEDQVTGDTLSFHYTIKDGKNFGIDEPNPPTLGDSSMDETAIAESKADDEKLLADLKAINYDGLSSQDKFDYDVILEYLETEMITYDYLDLYEPFSPMHGLQSNITTYFTDYTFYDKHDVENYLALMNEIPEYFQGYLDYEYVKAAKGTFMSDASCKEVIEQCDTFLENKEENFMYELFDNRIDELSFLTEDEKTEFKEQNKTAVRDGLIKGFENVKATFEELEGTGSYEGGICNYPGGKEYYSRYILNHYAGTTKTPEEVIEMLDNEMQNLLLEMYDLYKKNPDAYDYFADNFDTLFEDVDAKMSADEIIDKLMVDATAHYPTFDKIPYSSHYLDKSLETIMDNTLAYYMSPALDDPTNNIIYVNGLHTDGLWSTLAHEGFPGHMFQNAYWTAQNPEKVRTLYNFLGYKEGWAMYASYDAVACYDFGGSKDAEELAAFYRINDELSYLVMGRADIGINYEGWDVKQVEKYLSEQGFGSDGAQDMFDTLSGDPGLYQSYVTGYYELKELRTMAEEAMGAKFDVVAFNKVILDAGPCQYDLLREKVYEYINGN